jgi:hypothetical protein
MSKSSTHPIAGMIGIWHSSLRTQAAAVMRLFETVLHEGLMKHSPLRKESCDGGWRELYIAALFEKDKTKLAERIATAQLAICAKRQKSILSGNNVQERQALDNALFSLYALATSFAITPRSTGKAQVA